MTSVTAPLQPQAPTIEKDEVNNSDQPTFLKVTSSKIFEVDSSVINKEHQNSEPSSKPQPKPNGEKKV